MKPTTLKFNIISIPWTCRLLENKDWAGREANRTDIKRFSVKKGDIFFVSKIEMEKGISYLIYNKKFSFRFTSPPKNLFELLDSTINNPTKSLNELKTVVREEYIKDN